MTMRLRTVVRSSSATILLPFLIGFVVFFLGDDLTAWITPHYWVSATGSAAFALPFVAAACAGAAAWEGARLTKGRVFDQAPVRGPVAVTLSLALPVLATGLLGILTALTLAALAADVPFGLPQPGILAAVVAVLVANILVGSIVGRVMPGVLAAPLALIGSFFANAYPASWNVFWLRHLVGGGLNSCCSIDTSVDGTALLGTITFTTSASAAALVLIRLRGKAIALVAAGACAGAGLTTAWLLVRDLGPDPVKSRATSELLCDGTGRYQICLWPEVEEPTRVRQDTRTAAEKLEQAGVAVPRTLTMAAHPQDGAGKLGIAPNARPQDIPSGLASAILPPPPACALEGQPYPAADAAAPIGAWLQVSAGAPESTIGTSFGPETARLLKRVRALPTKEQLAWYESNRKAMSTCGAKPPLTISGGRG
ncbi:hypothetical protein ACIGO8_31295 [Streptomyces sp. NPDC053493]|uniref:DUF7224 domain-containing protein n=1 Tax=Streptomyces sp. NPDC053493 TaxID=3365705 RepID=UPI0037D4F54E